VAEVQKDRVDVSFEVRQDNEAEPSIVMLLSRDGKPVSMNEKIFSFKLSPNLTSDEASTLTQVLNQCVTHLVMGHPKE
jgi:hypothetical protein